MEANSIIDAKKRKSALLNLTLDAVEINLFAINYLKMNYACTFPVMGLVKRSDKKSWQNVVLLFERNKKITVIFKEKGKDKWYKKKMSCERVWVYEV